MKIGFLKYSLFFVIYYMYKVLKFFENTRLCAAVINRDSYAIPVKSFTPLERVFFSYYDRRVIIDPLLCRYMEFNTKISI